jgi:hypothetical protein
VSCSTISTVRGSGREDGVRTVRAVPHTEGVLLLEADAADAFAALAVPTLDRG